MKKIAFFFGAGAEGKGNFDICTGYKYLKSTLYASETLTGFEDALSKFLNKKNFFDGKFTYRKDTLNASNFVLKNFIIQKASQDRAFFDKYKNEILTLLSDEDIRHVCAALEINDPPKHITAASSKEKTEIIKNEIKEILTKEKKHSEIKSDLWKEFFKKGDKDQIYLDLNIGVAGSLDSYFHTIIDPCKYSAIRFSKIFNYYWACYFTILRDVLIFLSKGGLKDFDGYLIDGKELNYLEVLKNINKLTEKLYGVDVKALAGENSYYQIINKMLEQHKEKLKCVGVITTNYYRFCEIVFSKPIYLNGQLKLFEYPEWLEVVDITKESLNSNHLFFPFIFGQSLVKPIVSSVQTEEFHRLNKLLCGNESADVLVVMGYNINEDDNHINAFLHDYVKSGKKLIVVNDANSSIAAYKRLKCYERDVCVCEVSYGDNEAVVKAVFNKIADSGV